jgi:hypothetical protein
MRRRLPREMGVVEKDRAVAAAGRARDVVLDVGVNGNDGLRVVDRGVRWTVDVGEERRRVHKEAESVDGEVSGREEGSIGLVGWARYVVKALLDRVSAVVLRHGCAR